MSEYDLTEQEQENSRARLSNWLKIRNCPYTKFMSDGRYAGVMG